MPKIILNAREHLIEEAKKQINENGYSGVTIRSIAKGAGIGLGTFYNYFKSKDILIAAFLLEDWNERLVKIAKISEGDCDPIVLIKEIHSELGAFIKAHENIFTSPEAIKSFNNSVGGKHKLLREQIAAPIYTVCEKSEYENAEFLSKFIAECVLTWTVEGKSFEELEPLIGKLLVK